MKKHLDVHALLIVMFSVAILAATADSDAPAEKKKVAYLGVTTAPAGETLGRQLNLPAGVGLVVEHVDPDSPAGKVLKVHDVLHKLNEQVLVNHEQLATLIRTFNPGDTVDLVIIRGGKPTTVKAQLSERELPALPTRPGWPCFLRDRPDVPGFFRHSRDKIGELMEKLQQKLEDSGVAPDKMPALLKDLEDEINQFRRRFEDFQSRPRSDRTIRPSDEPSDRPTKPPRGSAEAQTFEKTEKAGVMADGTHSLSLNVDDRGSYLQVRDRDGKLVFEGPVDTHEQLKKVPPEVRPKLDEMRSFMKGSDSKRDSDRPQPNAL